MLGSIFVPLDEVLAVVLADHARLAVWAIGSGVLSMLLYKFASPQDKIHELGRQAEDIRQALNQYEGEFAGALPLIRTNLVLALQRLRCALAPSLLAGLPILLCLFGLDSAYTGVDFVPWGPEWVRWWGTGFLAVGSVAGLVTKVSLRIA